MYFLLIKNASWLRICQEAGSQLRQSGGHAAFRLVRPVTLRPCLSTGLPFLFCSFLCCASIIHQLKVYVFTKRCDLLSYSGVKSNSDQINSRVCHTAISQANCGLRGPLTKSQKWFFRAHSFLLDTRLSSIQ